MVILLKNFVFITEQFSGLVSYQEFKKWVLGPFRIGTHVQEHWGKLKMTALTVLFVQIRLFQIPIPPACKAHLIIFI